MIECKTALVRPHVISPDSGESILLEDAIAARLEDNPHRVIELVGGVGSGKSTALAHLAAAFAANEKLLLLDNADIADGVRALSTYRLVVCAAVGKVEADDRFCLAPWGDDELIEYLLAKAPQQCGQVMSRAAAASDRRRLTGNPELWQIALTQMLADPSVVETCEALRQGLRQRFADPESFRIGCLAALAICLNDEKMAAEQKRRLWEATANGRLSRLLHHRLVQTLLAAERISSALHDGRTANFPKVRMPSELIGETARLVSNSQPALDRLQSILDGDDTKCHPMAASIMHATGIGWTPRDGSQVFFNGAYFPGAAWLEVKLPGANLRESDLTQADLTGAEFTESGQPGDKLFRGLKPTLADYGRWRGACLQRARLPNMRAVRIDLSFADLSHAVASAANFKDASMEETNFESAALSAANFTHADLRGACFRAASLYSACLERAKVAGADFSDADLTLARLSNVDFREANLRGAALREAILHEANLEFIILPEANFEQADLSRALLTGSVMIGANFRGADLRQAGLADIDWEQADLRDSDLRDCSFHLGSSRSGLVGSPYPCEGSRTGFYTDDYHDQHFKAAEEIRKANLCGADLRGANLESTDFYLVDLRGAKFDADQETHLRRCGALLNDSRELRQ